jgi:hypothetical protein
MLNSFLLLPTSVSIANVLLLLLKQNILRIRKHIVRNTIADESVIDTLLKKDVIISFSFCLLIVIRIIYINSDKFI